MSLYHDGYVAHVLAMSIHNHGVLRHPSFLPQDVLELYASTFSLQRNIHNAVRRKLPEYRMAVHHPL